MISLGSLKKQVRKAILSGGAQDFQKAHLLESVCSLQNLLGDSAFRLTCLLTCQGVKWMGLRASPH